VIKIKNNRWPGVLTSVVILIFAGNAWAMKVQVGSDDGGVSRSDQRWFDYFESRFPAGSNGELISAADFDGDWDAAWFGRITDRFDQRPRNIRGRASGRSGGRGRGRVGQALWLEMMRQECSDNSDCRLAGWLESKRQDWIHWKDHRNSGSPGADPGNPPPIANPSPVPLPAPLMLFVSGLLGLAGFLRRSRKVAAQP